MGLDSFFSTMAQVIPTVFLAFLIEYRPLIRGALRPAIRGLRDEAYEQRLDSALTASLQGRLPSLRQVLKAVLKNRSLLMFVGAVLAFGLGETFSVIGLLVEFKPHTIIDVTSPAAQASRDLSNDWRYSIAANGALIGVGVLIALVVIGFIDRMVMEVLDDKASPSRS
jgi:hypothetical protein